jgi:hypothetical protein
MFFSFLLFLFFLLNYLSYRRHLVEHRSYHLEIIVVVVFVKVDLQEEARVVAEYQRKKKITLILDLK